MTFANLGTIAGPVGADWNASHIFNQEWPSHARFHGVVGLGTPTALAVFALWILWTRPREGRDIAAAVPIAYWGSFFPALLVRGTGLDDPRHRVGRVVGIPANLFWATFTTASAVVGWILDRHA
ncbi:MAG: hypothetical protein JOY61_13225 [Chloroflexi bacterium]|nr:hypothetical protein [Chloroflexota bacterium]